MCVFAVAQVRWPAVPVRLDPTRQALELARAPSVRLATSVLLLLQVSAFLLSVQPSACQLVISCHIIVYSLAVVV